MNGLEAIRIIRNICPDSEILLFTSEQGLDSCENQKQFGRFSFLEKAQKLLKRCDA